MTPSVKEKDTVLDKLEKYYRDEVSLSDQDQKIVERIELAFALLQKHQSKSVAIKKYMKILESQDKKINITTAYQDFLKVEKVLVPIHKVSKDLQRIVLLEGIDRDIAALRKKMTTKDEENKISTAQYLQIQDRINKLVELKMRASGIDKEDPNIPDFSMIQPPNTLFNMPPRMESMFRKFLQSGVFDVSEIFDQYEELEDDEPTE